MPVIDIPKYIRQLDILRFKTDDLEVIGEAADPDPYHPTVVQTKDSKVYFMKADNFLVNEDDQLWITDFGGSLTEGWVNPGLMEIEEGDNMGAERSLMRCMIRSIICKRLHQGHKRQRKFAEKEAQGEI
jgi:hypothetical protein